MTQSEFELQLLDLKQKQAKEIGTIEKMQQQVKEELSAKKRTVFGINQDCAKLRQELSLLHKRHLELSAKWGGQITAFTKEHLGQQTSNLAEADTLNIIYELRRRGYHGIIHKLAEDGTTVTEEYDIQKKDWKDKDNG